MTGAFLRSTICASADDVTASMGPARDRDRLGERDIVKPTLASMTREPAADVDLERPGLVAVHRDLESWVPGASSSDIAAVDVGVDDLAARDLDGNAGQGDVVRLITNDASHPDLAGLSSRCGLLGNGWGGVPRQQQQEKPEASLVSKIHTFLKSGSQRAGSKQGASGPSVGQGYRRAVNQR